LFVTLEQIKKYMKTQEYKKIYNIPFNFNDLLKLIKSLPIQDKIKIERELEKETLFYRSKLLSQKIEDNPVDMESIVAEISRYRLEKKRI